jgi:hypothetical protein
VEAESIRRELPVVRVGCSLDCMIVVGSLGRTIVATVDIEVVGSTIAGEDSHRGRNVAVRRIRLDQDTPCCRARESDEWWRRGVLSTRSDDVVNRTVGARSCGLTRTAVCLDLPVCRQSLYSKRGAERSRLFDVSGQQESK